MSTLIDGCLAACRAVPDDDDPRLVLADAYGGARGELVVVQCALARGGSAADRAGGLRRRQRELLGPSGAAWSGLETLAKRVVFRRGMVDSAEIDVGVFAQRSEDIFAAAPLLRCVLLTGMVSHGSHAARDPLPVLRRALAVPEARRLTGLQLDRIGTLHEPGGPGLHPTWSGAEDEAYELATNLGAFTQLRSTSIAGLRPAALQAVLETGQLARIERLHAVLPPTGAIALIAALPALRALSLPALSIRDIAHALPPSVTELAVLGAGSLTLLASSAVAATLEHLAVDRLDLARDPEVLAAFPRLRSLGLSGLSLGPDDEAIATRIAALHLPALRELALDRLSPAAAMTIATAFGPQLELLDLRGSAMDLQSQFRTLHDLVEGDVRLGAWHEPRELAFLGRGAHEPSLDVPVCELPR